MHRSKTGPLMSALGQKRRGPSGRVRSPRALCPKSGQTADRLSRSAWCQSGLMHRSIQPTGSRLCSITSSALASWGATFETVPTPMFLAARYPDRHARDETQRLPESGSSRFKPLLLILSGPGSRASRNGRECPVRNHTSGSKSIGDDEYEHSLPRR